MSLFKRQPKIPTLEVTTMDLFILASLALLPKATEATSFTVNGVPRPDLIEHALARARVIRAYSTDPHYIQLVETP